MANNQGIRNVGFEVDDLDAILDRMAGDGYRPIGGVGQYEDTRRMAQVPDPSGSSWPWHSASADRLA